MTQDPIIKLKDFSVFSDTTKQLVNNLDIEIYPKEILGIVGPSGAGKTTLLKGIALLNHQNVQGSYYYQKTKILTIINETTLIKARKNIIFIHQQPVLFKGNVRYNIEYGLRIRKRKIDSTILNDLISSFKLEKFLDRDVSSLSGGEKQRVSLLRAMAIKPQVLILDEPTQNLDPANIKNIEKNVSKFREEGGTVIIVTHNLFQAKRITDRILILVNGNAVEIGETKKLFSEPENTQAADFLSGNVIF